MRLPPLCAKKLLFPLPQPDGPDDDPRSAPKAKVRITADFPGPNLRLGLHSVRYQFTGVWKPCIRNPYLSWDNDNGRAVSSSCGVARVPASRGFRVAFHDTLSLIERFRSCGEPDMYCRYGGSKIAGRLLDRMQGRERGRERGTSPRQVKASPSACY